MIYFDRTLQERVLMLFRDSLCRKGFLGLGAKESLRAVSMGSAFSEFSREDRIYQKY
jgi:chemotaxis protein methyltransferase CheR